MKSSGAKYYSKLDHLRLLAAVMVLLWHVMRYAGQVPSAYVPSVWPLSFAEEGHTGVALFMTLSGFVFQTLCCDSEIRYFEFLRNRVLRIAPLFFVWTLLYFYIGDVNPVNLVIAIAALLNKGTVPGIGWTIIVEFQFYAIFPFLLLFARKLGLRYLCFLLGLAIVLRWGVWGTKSTVQDLAYSTIFGRIDQFLLGMIASEFLRRYPGYFRSPIVLFLLIVLWSYIYYRFNLLGGYFNNNGYPSPSTVWIYLPTLEGVFYGFITAAYMGTIPLFPSVIDKFLAWLGTLSYSLYLNHVMVVELTIKWLNKMGWHIQDFWSAFFGGILMVFPVLVVVSVGTFYLIERPFLLLRGTYLQKIQ